MNPSISKETYITIPKQLLNQNQVENEVYPINMPGEANAWEQLHEQTRNYSYLEGMDGMYPLFI